MCHNKKTSLFFLCLGCEGRGNVSREVHLPPYVPLFYLQTECQYFPARANIRVPLSLALIFSTETLCQLDDFPCIAEHLSCVGDPVASDEKSSLWLEMSVSSLLCNILEKTYNVLGPSN